MVMSEQRSGGTRHMSQRNSNSPTILPDMDLGVMSIPCCMKAPSANQRLLMMLKWLETVVPDMDSSICHSYGENLEKKYPLNSIYLFDWIQQRQPRWTVTC